MAGSGPNPYDFEPTFTPEERARQRLQNQIERQVPPVPLLGEAAGHREPANNRDGVNPPPPDRMANNNWCTCGCCMPIDTPVQCKCCQELENCDRFISLFDQAMPVCITQHTDFPKVCLEKAVLRTALVARLDTKGHRSSIPDELDNVSYRYAAYRFFTYWTHGVLGKGVRKVIPACVVIRIRSTFPAPDGVYKGFYHGDGGELLELPEQLAI